MLSQRGLINAILSIIAFTSGLIACGGGDSDSAASSQNRILAQSTAVTPRSTLKIQPSNPSIKVGNTLLLTATVAGSDRIPTGTQWSSNNPAIATIDVRTGMVTGVAAGKATVKATANGLVGSTLVTVTEPMIISPANAKVLIGKNTLQLSVTRGNVAVPATSLNWSIDTSWGSIDASGLFTSVNAGGGVNYLSKITVSDPVTGETASANVMNIGGGVDVMAAINPVTNNFAAPGELAVIQGQVRYVKDVLYGNPAQYGTPLEGGLNNTVTYFDSQGNVLCQVPQVYDIYGLTTTADCTAIVPADGKITPQLVPDQNVVKGTFMGWTKLYNGTLVYAN
jgi:hypothetical protein